MPGLESAAEGHRGTWEAPTPPDPLAALSEPQRPRRRRHGFRQPKGRLIAQLDAERVAMIAAAPVTMEERDGRVWRVVKLPARSA